MSGETFGLLLGLSMGLALWAAAIAATKQRSMLFHGTLAFMLTFVAAFAVSLARDATVLLVARV